MANDYDLLIFEIAGKRVVTTLLLPGSDADTRKIRDMIADAKTTQPEYQPDPADTRFRLAAALACPVPDCGWLTSATDIGRAQTSAAAHWSAEHGRIRGTRPGGFGDVGAAKGKG